MIVLTAAIAAIVVMVIHYRIEYHLNRLEKQEKCGHYQRYTTTYVGLKTEHCKECGKQWPKYDN